ncbi:MAG TPA: GntR family transcriptional regulator [Stellaceae bacterium]|nr:GntR family transcriptional regulator [Stellaceae bacterium]
MAASLRPAALHRLAPPESVQAASARLHAELHADIITGRLRPGASLSETKVAEHYGISRTPVREVFRRLADEGLLRVVPQVATYVAPINLAAVTDSQFIRETLECRAVSLSAEKASERDIRSLRQEIRAQEQAIAAGNRTRFFASDEAMHQRLMTIAGYPAVWDLIGSAKAQLDRVRHLSLEQEDWLSMIFRQHRSIVDRVGARDAAGAAGAMQEHLRTVFAAVERIAAEHAEFFDEPRQKRVRRA